MKRINLKRVAAIAVALSLSVAAATVILNKSVTLATATTLSLDTGATSSTGGDLLWNGSTIVFQGSAKGANLSAAPYSLSGQSGYAEAQELVSEVPASQLTSFVTLTSSLSASALTANSVFAVLTNGGNVGVALVTANSGGSITIEFSTYGSSTSSGGTGGATVPTITDIENNSSLIPAGFGNSGISPSSIFVIHGSNMASATTVTALQDSTKAPLPTTAGLNGAVVTVSAGGKNYTPGLYYAEATQIAGVMPAAVPPGPATLTVSYNNQTSAAFSFTVVASAFGIDVYDGNYAVLQDSVSGAIITPTNSAKPGEDLTIWGTAIGADPGDSDVSYSSSPQAINTQVQLYIGGVLVPQSNILYVGSLGYPGVNGVVFTVPSNIPEGCFDSVAVVTGGSTVSNIAVGSFMPSGGVCTDAYTGLNGTTIGTLTGSANYSYGFVEVGQYTSPGAGGTPTTINEAVGSFEQISGSFTISTSGDVSVGSCSLSEGLATGSSTSTITETGLNAGTLTVTGPGASPVTLQNLDGEPGLYLSQLASGAIPTSGGTFTFNATGGSGANSIGPFTTTVNFPNPILNWTNQSAAATITRSAGYTYQWSGGASGTYVVVTGGSSSGSVSASYYCVFPQSAGQGTVPAYILSALPAGTGSSSIENSTSFNSFSASGLTYGYAVGYVGFGVTTVYQ